MHHMSVTQRQSIVHSLVLESTNEIKMARIIKKPPGEKSNHAKFTSIWNL